MTLDRRELRIILQNSMAHATKIFLHNSKDKKVNHEDVIKLAKEIAGVVYHFGEPKVERLVNQPNEI